jgi:diacylglycerol kinase family enzyme
MPSALLIANPAARGFTSTRHRSAVAQLRRTYEVEAAWPSTPEEGRSAAREAAADGFDVVVAMGGDGIAHHVIQGLAGTGTPIGLIPVGTANVLARQLGIPLRTGAAARLVADDHLVVSQPALEVDILDAGRPVRRLAAFALGVGADAEIVAAAEAEPLRKRGFGAFHYAATSVRVVLRRLGRHATGLTITAGDLSCRGIGAMAQFRTSYTYFGGAAMRVSPQLPDPITLLIVEQLRVRRAPAMLRATMGSRGLEQVRGFRVWAGIESFEARGDQPVLVQADGEILGRFGHVRVTHRPEAFSAIVPLAGRSREG